MTTRYNSIEHALKVAIEASGGIQNVAAKMRPDVLREAAGKWLSDCLNPARREKLDINEIVSILRMAHEHGFHDAMDYFAAQCGYEGLKPITTEARIAMLEQQYAERAAALDELKHQIEELRKATPQS